MDKLKIGKIVGLLLTLGGTAVTALVTSKENERTLEKLVNKKGE
jgi:hypothetical protein